MTKAAAAAVTARTDGRDLITTNKRGESRSAAAPQAKAIVDRWFAGGERLAYDADNKAFAEGGRHRIWTKISGDPTHAVTFMPGFPDGSIGWSYVDPFLPDAGAMPRIHFDYLGMGDSNKPRRYPYSIAERTDMVEALWRRLGVRSTVMVAFDFSSLIVLEHLRRRLDGAKGGPQIRGVFIFNGGLFTDGHSHPWYTTPLLAMPGGGVGPFFGKRSAFVFKQLAAVLWSPAHRVSDVEVRTLYEAMNRHDGIFYLAAGAGFVNDHKRQGKRLDFGALYRAYKDEIPFLIGGSRSDPFERRQVKLSEKRLGKLGLKTAWLDGGHLTTSEQPGPLAKLITDFVANTRDWG